MLPKLLSHLQDKFHFDQDEARRLLTMLRSTLTGAIPVLLGDDAAMIYQRVHKLHSELHICGYGYLATLAMSIEVQARQGIADRTQIDELLDKGRQLTAEIDVWMDGPV
jgi:HPt (histidine-containing phosphotransfer) domain-containing protein